MALSWLWHDQLPGFTPLDHYSPGGSYDEHLGQARGRPALLLRPVVQVDQGRDREGKSLPRAWIEVGINVTILWS